MQAAGIVGLCCCACTTPRGLSRHPQPLPAACYALEHPERVQHLILMCPAGVGKKPDDWQPPAVVRNPWTVRGQMFR